MMVVEEEVVLKQQEDDIQDWGGDFTVEHNMAN
jgi:hypothetical protein